jgi:hypothetical protein
MRKGAPAFSPFRAGILSMLALAVPVQGRADPSAAPPHASDPYTDSQTIQHDIHQRYQQMGAAQRAAHQKLHDRSLHPPAPPTRGKDDNPHPQQQEEEGQTRAPER